MRRIKCPCCHYTFLYNDDDIEFIPCPVCDEIIEFRRWNERTLEWSKTENVLEEDAFDGVTLDRDPSKCEVQIA